MIKPILLTCFKYLFTFLFGSMYIFFELIRWFRTRNKPLIPLDLSTEPSCLHDPNLGQHGSLLLKKRNVEIHYVAKGDRSKPLMLFLHGFPEFWYSWRQQLKEFGKDYYAVAIDMTGYGESSKPKEIERYKADEIAEDVKEFILELGYESCILIGHDWGGAISYTVAYNFPEVVSKVIVMNCPNKPGFTNGMTFKQFMKSGYVYYFQVPYIPEYFLSRDNCAFFKMLQKQANKKDAFTDEDINAYRYMFTKAGFYGPLNYYRNALNVGQNKEKKMKSKVPTLIIWGTGDVVLSKHLAETSARYIENCDVKYVEGASHWVNQDCPEEVNKIVHDYLGNSS